MKTGRNEPCTCGSGLKYKRCCWDNDENEPAQTASEYKDEEKEHPFFSEYSTAEQLKSFAALTLMPLNYGKNFRLEQLGTFAAIAENKSKKFPSAEEIKSFTDSEYPSSYMEDPCINLFTDPVTFYGGDYLLLPGITETSKEIISNLLTAIFKWPSSNLPDQFRSNIRHVSRLLLMISERVAKKAGLIRYMEGESADDLIVVPSEMKLQELKAAVTFTDAEMQSLLEEHSIAKEALKLFVLIPDTLKDEDLESEQNPFLYRPIIHLDGQYVVSSPATIGLSLAAYIWSEASASGCVSDLGESYHDVIWNATQLYLRSMSFEAVTISGADELKNARSGFYTFDTDKIAYISYVGDNGKGYDKNPGQAVSGAISPDETERAFEILRADVSYGGFKVMQVKLLSMIGRNVYMMIEKHGKIPAINISVFAMETLWRLHEIDAIDLWKFAIARDQRAQSFRFVGASELDLLKFYKDHNDSFYYTDEIKDAPLPMNIGGSEEWLTLAKIKNDEHSAEYPNSGRTVALPVQRKDTYAPIYVNIMDLNRRELRFNVGGFAQDIWVKPAQITTGVGKELGDIYWQLTDAIAYWLWQVQRDLRPFLEKLDDNPIILSFDLDEPSKFEDIKHDFTRKDDLPAFFKVVLTEWGFNITVPHQLIAYLYGSDNEGERTLVSKMLDGFSQFLASKKLPVISPENRSDILEKNAPLGMKKKFFIIDSSDNLLIDPRNLKGHRFVQEYDVSKVLDAIVPALGAECPPIGEIGTKEERQAFAYKITTVTLVNLLREKLALYDSSALLKILLGKHEALIHKREEMRIHTPTRIECFVSAEQHIFELEEEMTKLSTTTLSIRGIIEQIIAEPNTGRDAISTTDVDELIGIMDQIISWGFTSDHIYFNLFDIKIAVLKSGRIGTDKTIHHDVFDPYHSSKASEAVRDAIGTFKQVFPQNSSAKGKDVPKNLDDAFKEDYGITFTRICQFIDGLAEIGFSQERDYASVPLPELIHLLNKGAYQFEEDEFNAAFAFLALTNRGNVNTIPDGYQDIDVQPWRFSRLLSMMRRPLLIAEESGIETAFWGARHVLSTKLYLAELCQMDRFRVLKKDKAVKKVLGEFAQIRGDRLVKKVVNFINDKDLIVETDQYIGPKEEHNFKHDHLIGDIDVLIIDPIRKEISSLECKAMAPSRNIREMVEESGKLFGTPDKKGWIEKHMERDSWLKANLHQLSAKFGIDVSDFEVQSFFVTGEDMLTPYLREMDLPLPFLSSYALEKEGYALVLKHFNKP